MKTKSIIIIAVCVYAAAMAYTLGWGVDFYIDEKVSQLKMQNSKKFSEVFEQYGNRYIIDVAFPPSNKVIYEEVAIPQKPVLKPSDHIEFKDGNLITTPGDSITESDKQDYTKQLEHWNDYYGDISQMYMMQNKNWLLLEIYFQGYHDDFGEPFFDVYGIYPYAVGYFKQEYPNYYSYEPSVESALETAYDFWTTSKKSHYIEKGVFAKGNYDKSILELRACNNKYYWLQEEDRDTTALIYYNFGFDDRYNPTDKHISFDNIKGRENGYMYNGYYKVYDAKIWLSRWSVKKRPQAIASDRKSLRIKWAIGLTVALLAIIIPLIVIDKKRSKIESETLCDKLKRLCNPANFLKNYDKEKVDVANEIYQKLLQTNPDDTETLNEVQKIAVEKLKISLIDTSLLNALKKKVNPKNFMKNYDAEKVTLANDLYSRLSKEDLTYNEFVEIQELAKKL